MTQEIDSHITDFTSTEVLMYKLTLQGVWNKETHT